MSNIEELKNIPEISFIENKSQEDILNELTADYLDKLYQETGRKTSLPSGHPMRLLLNATAMMIYQALQYVDKTGKQDLLKYSTGGFLDNIGAIKKVVRKKAQRASVILKFEIDDVRGQNTSIPGGTRVTTDENIYFMTDQYAEISTGERFVEVKATALEAGTAGSGIMIGEINKIVDPVAYIKTVRNISVSAGGADIESDDDLTRRIYYAPASYSVAGPREAYEYHAKDFRSDIGQAKAFSPAPTEVTVVFLLSDGQIPNENDILQMQKHLSAETIRPLTDVVYVEAPQEVEYDIDFTYYINCSDSSKAVAIQNAVIKSVGEYTKWQRSIGRDINPSELIKRIVQAGAKRVVLREPLYMQVEDFEVSKRRLENILYGGLEDD